MVTSSRSSQSTAYIRQLLTVLPSILIVQAPHSPSPQAYLVPVMPSLSRSMARVFMVTGTFRRTSRPLSLKRISVSTDIIEHLFNEHTNEMAAIPRTCTHVIDGFGILRRRGDRGGDGRGFERSLDMAGAQGRGRDRAHGNTHIAESAPGNTGAEGDRNGGDFKRGARAGLAEPADEAGRGPVEHYAGQQLFGQFDGLTRTDEDLFQRYLPLPHGAVAPACEFDRGAQYQQGRDHIAGRRGVAQVATHRRRVANLLAGEMLGRLDQNGRDCSERGVAADFADRRQGTDANLVTCGFNAAQSFDAANVQQFRFVLAHAGLGLWCEVRTAAQHGGIAVRHCLQCLVQAARRQIAGYLLHGLLSILELTLTWLARQGASSTCALPRYVQRKDGKLNRILEYLRVWQS